MLPVTEIVTDNEFLTTPRNSIPPAFTPLTNATAQLQSTALASMKPSGFGHGPRGHDEVPGPSHVIEINGVPGSRGSIASPSCFSWPDKRALVTRRSKPRRSNPSKRRGKKEGPPSGDSTLNEKKIVQSSRSGVVNETC